MTRDQVVFVSINSLKRIESILSGVKRGWQSYLWIGGALPVLILCWYFLSPLNEDNIKQYQARLSDDIASTVAPDISEGPLPELQPDYTFGNSAIGADHEVDCIYKPDKQFLNCPEIVKVVTKPAPGFSQDEARDRAHLAMLKQVYHSSSLKEYFVTGGPLDPELTLEQEATEERIETGDGEVYVQLPPRNPLTNYTKKAKAQQELYCKRMAPKWLTLKAKRAAGC